MNPLRSVGIATVLLFALCAVAQQARPSPADDSVPAVKEQLKVLTAKLALTGHQEAAITPILQQLRDETLKIVEGESLSREERLDKVRPWHYEANRQIRVLLDDDQKKKLDEYLRGPHPEMHGDISGSAPRSPSH